MTSQCRGVTPVTIIVMTCAVALCANAQAGPLLSGYGGPGQGSQAIIGAALVNGPPSGGGGSGGGPRGGGGSDGGGGSQSAPAATPSPTPPAAGSAIGRSSVPRGTGAGALPGAAAFHARGGSGAHRSSARRTVAVGAASVHRAPALPSGVYPAAEKSAAGSSGTLGLTGGDLLTGALVLGLLGLAFLAMRRLSERPGTPGPSDERLGTGG